MPGFKLLYRYVGSVHFSPHLQGKSPNQSPWYYAFLALEDWEKIFDTTGCCCWFRPAGSSAAEILASSGIETYLFERKLNNAKPCGGAIPLCMVSGLTSHLIDRKVRKMKMISPSNRGGYQSGKWRRANILGCAAARCWMVYARSRAAQLGAKFN